MALGEGLLNLTKSILSREGGLERFTAQSLTNREMPTFMRRAVADDLKMSRLSKLAGDTGRQGKIESYLNTRMQRPANFVGPGAPQSAYSGGGAGFSIPKSMDDVKAMFGRIGGGLKDVSTHVWKDAVSGGLGASMRPLATRAVQGAAVGTAVGMAGNMFAPNLVNTDNPLGAAVGGAALGAGLGALGFAANSITKAGNKFAPWLVSGARMTQTVTQSPVTQKALFAAGAMGASEWNLTRARNPNPNSRR